MLLWKVTQKWAKHYNAVWFDYVDHISKTIQDRRKDSEKESDKREMECQWKWIGHSGGFGGGYVLTCIKW